jgi:hypothetical protein
MRAKTLLVLVLVFVGLAVPSAAQAATSTLTLKAKITRFEARGSALTATGVITGKLGSGGQVARDRAPVRFRVSQRRRGMRCDILTLNLQQLFLELLGARVDTSAINLELYARRGAILGNLFCALSRAKIRLPRVAAAMNRKLDGRPLRVMAAQAPMRAAEHQGTCQVLKLILGPLHLDLLGLNVDLYGRTKRNPVVVTITALPGHGLLGDVLCSLAGGASITSLAALQNLLQSLGVTISDLDLQHLLDRLGIGDLTNGLTNLELERILQALGVTGVPVPSPPRG